MEATYVKLLAAANAEQTVALFSVRVRDGDEKFFHRWPDLQLVQIGLVRAGSVQLRKTFTAVVITPTFRRLVPVAPDLRQPGTFWPKFEAVLYEDDGKAPLSEFFAAAGIEQVGRTPIE